MEAWENSGTPPSSFVGSSLRIIGIGNGIGVGHMEYCFVVGPVQHFPRSAYQWIRCTLHSRNFLSACGSKSSAYRCDSRFGCIACCQGKYSTVVPAVWLYRNGCQHPDSLADKFCFPQQEGNQWVLLEKCKLKLKILQNLFPMEIPKRGYATSS